VLCIAEPRLAANEFLKLTAFSPRLRAVICFLLIPRDLMFYILDLILFLLLARSLLPLRRLINLSPLRLLPV
jgi:hypothetical protein